MKANDVLWGAIVTLAGAIVFSFGTLAVALTRDPKSGTASDVVGIGLMLIGLIGPCMCRFLKKAYDEAPID